MELKVLVVDADQSIRQSIRNMLQSHGDVEIAGEAEDAAAARRLATERRPDAVLLEIGERAEEAFALAEWLRVEQSDAAVVMTSSAVRPEVMRRAMRAGAQDLIARPVDACQLQQALDHAMQQKALRLRALGARGMVTAVLGVSGGIGTTTIATNLAVGMAPDFGPVVLVDFDFDMGAVPSFLDLGPERTYLDLRRTSEGLDADGLRQFTPRHRTGVFMLAGPQKLEELDEVTPDDIGKVLNLCRSAFRQVVVDGGHGLDERRIEVLDRADRILLVTQLSVVSLRNARRVIELMGRLGYQDGRIKLVANRVSKSSGVTSEDVERSLGQKLDFQVFNDYPAAIDAIDTGVPMVEGSRKSRAVADLLAMARDLAEATPSKAAAKIGAAALAGGAARGSTTGAKAAGLAADAAGASGRTGGGSAEPRREERTEGVLRRFIFGAPGTKERD